MGSTLDAAQFIEKSKKGAQDLAERKGLLFRHIRTDQNNLMSYPEDVRTDRICIEIDNGKVTKATIQ